MIEHRLIERMVAAISKEQKKLEQGGAPDLVMLHAAVDFMRTYADQNHHGKEEDILFAKLATKSMSPPMEQAMRRLIEEHVIARGLVKRLDELIHRCSGDEKATVREIKTVLSEIALLYPDHIAREDKEFFPTAMTYLDAQERDRMLQDFEEFEKGLVHKKYKKIVEEVESR